MNFAIIGYGRIGQRHADIIHDYPGTALVATVDPYNNGDGKTAHHHSLSGFLRSKEKADIAIIASPNGYHCQQALELLEAGLHVVIEKPMGLTRTECEKVVHRSLQTGKQVFVVKQNRYSPPAKWLKKVIDQNLLGEIYLTQTNCFWNRDERYYQQGSWKGTRSLDGGVLYTQFSHFIDIMHWVFGDIQNIRTRLQNFKHQNSTDFPDSGIAHFDWERGGMGSLQFSTATWDRNMESSLTVIGEKGSLKIGGQYMDKIEYCHIRDYSAPELPATEAPNQYQGYQGSAGNHYLVIDNVVKTLRSEATITANALEGMKVVDIIERIYGAGR